MRGTTALAVTSILVLAAAGCGDDDGAGDPRGGDWPAVSEPLGEDVVMGPVEIDGSEVTLGDGATIDLGSSVETFVVAGEGIFAVTDRPEFDNADDPDHPTLVYVTADGVDELAAEPDPDTLRTSPDGRYLGFIDYATAPVTAVVLDLAEGEEVVRSDDGMGEEGEGDLAALYDELTPAVFAVTDEIAYVASTGPVYSFALPSGDQSTVAGEVEEIYDDPWFTELPDGEVTQFPRDGVTGE